MPQNEKPLRIGVYLGQGPGAEIRERNLQELAKRGGYPTVSELIRAWTDAASACAGLPMPGGRIPLRW